jgi:RHS repeat-associated protein
MAIARYLKQAGQADKIYYVCRDYLGSIVKLVDGNGTVVFSATYDAWGNRTVETNTFAFHRGYTGHEHLDEFGLIDMNGRMYDPVLGRFLSPDPFVQMPDFSQNFNRYSYCLNNPLRYSDPSGECFGIDDLLVAGAGFAFGYVSYGLSTNNWGWSAVGAGAIGAGMAWLGYNLGGLAIKDAAGATTWAPGMGINSQTWAFTGSMALNTAAGQLIPSIPIPIGDHFSLSVYPGLGLGSSGLTGSVNIGVGYSNGDLSIGAGIGIGGNYWGWNAAATYDGYGGGYGRTYYDAGTVMGHKFDAQTVGTFTAYWDGGSFSLSNDAFGDGKDRWRSNAVELNIGRFSVGTYIYTNNGKKESKGKNDMAAPLIGKNKKEAWENGRVYFAPAWAGYKHGNQITRIGFSHPMVQNLTQNLIHKYVTPTPYFLNYDEFKSGGYFYSGYNNPFSLWER